MSKLGKILFTIIYLFVASSIFVLLSATFLVYVLLSVLVVFGLVIIWAVKAENSSKSKRKRKDKLEADRSALEKEIKDLKQKLQHSGSIQNMAEVIQGSNSLKGAAAEVLNIMVEQVKGCQGICYLNFNPEKPLDILPAATFAYPKPLRQVHLPEEGIGMIGLVMREKKPQILEELPTDYVEVISGLGKTTPVHLAIYPFLNENQVIGIIEIASFEHFSESDRVLLEQMQKSIGAAFFNLRERLKFEGELKKELNLLNLELTSSEEDEL